MTVGPGIKAARSQQVSYREDWNVFSDLNGWTSGGMNQTETRQARVRQLAT
jgi:hypothetical protein